MGVTHIKSKTDKMISNVFIIHEDLTDKIVHLH